jgi:catechol 2,3-dioxygenase-like lactoylglutathione lyase family enzyme
MTIKRIHHVQITVAAQDVAAARKFYIEDLGLTETTKPQSLLARGGFWVEVADQQLHIGVEEGVDRAATKAHVAYEVDNLSVWRRKLSARGIEMLDGIPIPGYERFECRDPFGNRIEFIAKL